MINIDIEHIIAKSLSGEISSDEIIILSDWLAASENNKEEFQKIKEYWESDISLEINSSPSGDFDMLLKRIKTGDNVKAKKNRVKFHTFIAAAAAAIAALLVYSFFFENKGTKEVRYYSYISGNGVSEFVLPDSTHITLNKNSTLTYTDAFGVNEREVNLVGEAYFDVKKNKEKKFIVNADKSKIIVLGTIFSVKNRPEDNILKTSLVEGSVRFESPGQNLTLSPNKQVTFDKINNEIEVEKFDPDIEIAWAENLIRYKSMTFRELMKMISERYNTEIILPQKELHISKLTGSVDADLSVEQVLDLIKKNVPYRWKKEGTTYVISY